MESPTIIEPTADAVRIAIADAVHDASAFCAEEELPHAEDSLSALETALRNNRFTVLVCGEAKRGKSTFINALIGRNLLPTDVDIATSQVFQIRNGEPESFLVRYEDESGQFISASDLALHGSQVVQDTLKDSAQLSTTPDMTVKQIEVMVPTVHLPQEITLLDTPGIGSLYSGHARITYRFMPQADAVIFVLDSQAPITQPELAFLMEIVPITRHIFFLQTRIDQFQQNDWVAVYERNRTLLREALGEMLTEYGGEISVWPVSSKNLLLASKTGSKELLQVSRFPAMLTALRRFLFQVTGVMRARHVLTQMSGLYGELRPVLQARIAAATGESMDYSPEGLINAFEEAWGPNSVWRRDLETQLLSIREQYRTAFQDALRPGAELETSLQAKIDGLSDIANAERLAHALSHEAIERTNLLWRQTTERATNAMSEKIAPLCGRMRGESALVEGLMEQTLSVEDVITAEQTTRIKDTWTNRARYLWRESGVLVGVGAAVGFLIPGVGHLLGLAVLATGGAGWLLSGGKLAEQVKPEMVAYLQSVLDEIRGLYVTTHDEGQNRTERFFDELEAAARYAVNREYGRKIAEYEREAERLRVLATSTEDEEDATAISALRDGLAKWETWGEHLVTLNSLLDQVAQSPTTPTTSPGLPRETPAVAAARESIRARARIAADENGDIDEDEEQKLIAEAQRRGLSSEEASAIIESVFTTSDEMPAPIPVADTPKDDMVSFRTALVTALREGGDDGSGEIPPAWETRLDQLAEAAKLTRSVVRRMEGEIREELAAAARAATVSTEETPDARYKARFRVALAQAGGASAELNDMVLDELDSFAIALSLPRSEVRRLEREARHEASKTG